MITEQARRNVQIIRESRQRCVELGLDPAVFPQFTQRLPYNMLQRILSQYEEVLEVVTDFTRKFLTSVQGTPILVLISDDKGHIIKFEGDKSFRENVNKFGIVEGVQFIEEDAGINSITLALRYDQPIQVIGKEHYHDELQAKACYSVPFRSKDDQKLLGTLTLFMPVEFANPLFLALLCTTVDSIERELLLRKQNAQLHFLNQILLETSNQAVIITDFRGNILDCNENASPILAFISPDLKEYRGANVFPMEPLGTYFQHVLANRQKCIGVDLTLCMHDTPRHFLLDVVPIYDKKGCLVRAVGSLRDISEIKKTEVLLQDMEKLSLVGQLAAGVAHEIRNPLTVIKGWLQFSKDKFNPEQYELMMSELDRMNFIVSEFLVLGKPQAAQYKKADCLDILKKILKIFSPQATMNGITIATDIRSHGYIYCDSGQIKQVFMNILKNAMEAMPYGGHIDVIVEIKGSQQFIRFRDNGEGMPEEVLQKLGQPFYSTKPNGNGLGLMMTKKIIASHQGQIYFASQVNSGTAVDIFLPLFQHHTGSE